ncbi:MAG: hypothetical protein ACKOC5_19245, partial [Chloroflexota bacterium]
LTLSAGRVSLRRDPGRSAPALARLAPGDSLTLLDGPLSAGGATWLRVRIHAGGQVIEGWLPADPAWYERVP